MLSSWLLSLALLGAQALASLPTISTSGNKFFDSNGNQFFIKGIAYQLSPDDPLVDGDQCTRDATLMKTLGTNTIRVYHVDPSADHSSCMQTFENAGIYLIIDLDTFDTYILPDDLYWNSTQYNRYGQVIDAFAKYDNTLGFWIGNEIIIKSDQSMAAPYIKAAVRDMKGYRNSKGYRNIPIGYAAADIAELRPMLQDYLTCGGNASENIDFFGLNSYEWCGTNTYQGSGYANLESEAKNFPVPIFFSETGCIKPAPRDFADQDAIFGPNMVNDWSGAIIYEWIQEENQYGLISYGASAPATATVTRSGTPTPISPDFYNLKSRWATISPTGVSKSNYNPSSVSTRSCPASTATGWLINGNVALPSLGAKAVSTYSTSATINPATLPTTTTSSTPTGSSSASGSQASNKSGAAPSSTFKLTGMCSALVGAMLIFTLWL